MVDLRSAALSDPCVNANLTALVSAPGHEPGTPTLKGLDNIIEINGILHTAGKFRGTSRSRRKSAPDDHPITLRRNGTVRRRETDADGSRREHGSAPRARGHLSDDRRAEQLVHGVSRRFGRRQRGEDRRGGQPD